MGLFDWIKRNDAEKKPQHSVTTRSVSVNVEPDAGVQPGDPDGLADPERRAALEQVDHLAHELLTAAGDSGSAGGLIVTQSTQVVVDGQMVSPDDPRALAELSMAAAKLRGQGLDELAADLEARVAAASATGPPASVAAQQAGGSHALPPAAGTEPAAEAAPTGAPWPAGSDAGAAPSPPAPPEPPSPPS